jgi:hypothetical protein
VDLAALGAFLSGIGAVLGAGATVYPLRRKCEQDCNRRIQEIRAAIHEGYEMKDGA